MATLGAWANIMMMPNYASLADCNKLTANFRGAFLFITHDVMLQRMKKAANKLVKEAREARKGDISEKEEAEGYTWKRSEAGPTGYLKEGVVGETSANAQVPSQEFWDFKKIKEIPRGRDQQQSMQEYLREVWPMVNASTRNEDATRLWLSCITSQPLPADEPAQRHYERLVLRDFDDEEGAEEGFRPRPHPLTSVAWPKESDTY